MNQEAAERQRASIQAEISAANSRLSSDRAAIASLTAQIGDLNERLSQLRREREAQERLRSRIASDTQLAQDQVLQRSSLLSSAEGIANVLSANRFAKTVLSRMNNEFYSSLVTWTGDALGQIARAIMEIDAEIAEVQRSIASAQRQVESHRASISRNNAYIGDLNRQAARIVVDE